MSASYDTHGTGLQQLSAPFVAWLLSIVTFYMISLPNWKHPDRLAGDVPVRRWPVDSRGGCKRFTACTMTFLAW